ncbi:MAG: tyrosine-type recombinase/integrase [Anaerolineales bacterium]|nr:tyrosine-type recombinase/integrase [Anaerolineales bacterium]
MKLSQATQIYLTSRIASGYSDKTLAYYRSYLNRWVRHLGDPELESVTHADLVAFMAWLRTEYVPHRLNGDSSPLSNAALAHNLAVINAFYVWAHAELKIERPDLGIKRPKFAPPEITTFTKEEVKRMLEAAEFMAVAKPGNRRSYRSRRPSAKRDKAILLILLDTGLRISELIRLTMSDLRLPDQNNRIPQTEITVRAHGSGRKSRPRTVYLSSASTIALQIYLLEDRPKILFQEDSIFAYDNQPMDRHNLRKIITRIGERAGVPNVYPHKFRHTFATEFLRNGGDVFTLQRLLGHSTLKMVERYLHLVKSDLKEVHKTASPVDRWRL